MNKTFSLTRTAAGLRHRNTLVVPIVKTVVVFIDQPHFSSEMRDSFRLIGKESVYDRTLHRSDAVQKDELRMVLFFTEVPALGTYSLYHVLTTEIEISIFLDVPFGDLLSFGEEGPAPSKEVPGKPVFQDAPQSELEDPLLHVTAADPESESSRYLDLLAYRTQKTDASELA